MAAWTKLEQCQAFLEQWGMATILPSQRQFLPCLLWGARGHQGPFEDWDDACTRVWQWKDELPGQRAAFSGRVWGTQVVLIHSRLLPAFLGWRGGVDLEERYREGQLSREALSIARELGQEPRLGRQELRRRTALTGKALSGRFDRGCLELERLLQLTRSGRASEGSGWDSCTYSLVSRHFPDQVAAALPPSQARAAVEAALRQASPELAEARIKRLLG